VNISKDLFNYAISGARNKENECGREEVERLKKNCPSANIRESYSGKKKRRLNWDSNSGKKTKDQRERGKRKVITGRKSLRANATFSNLQELGGKGNRRKR